MKNLLRNNGVSLVELMLAVFVLSIGIAGILLLFVNAMLSTEYAWDMTVATTHAEYILEEMQLKDSLKEIQETDWKKWMHSQAVVFLPEEDFTVAYEDLSADPLEIRVGVQWKRKKRMNHISLKTKITK